MANLTLARPKACIRLATDLFRTWILEERTLKRRCHSLHAAPPGALQPSVALSSTTLFRRWYPQMPVISLPLPYSTTTGSTMPANGLRWPCRPRPSFWPGLVCICQATKRNGRYCQGGICLAMLTMVWLIWLERARVHSTAGDGPYLLYSRLAQDLHF